MEGEEAGTGAEGQESSQNGAAAGVDEAAALTARLTADLETLRATNAQLEAGRAAAEQATAAALASGIEKTKAALAAQHGIPAELLSGATFDELDASLEQAKTVVEKVKARVLAEAKLPPVPTGGAGQQAIDLSALSAREKLVLGVNGTRTVR